jgi:hypothetical protein
MILLALNALFFFLLFITLGICKKNTVKVMNYVDFAPISGGNDKNFVGGVITMLYYFLLASLISGILIKYFF